jgi:hypothetical protein
MCTAENVKNAGYGGGGRGNTSRYKHFLSACCQIIHILKPEFVYLEIFNIYTVSIAPFFKYNIFGTGWVSTLDKREGEASTVLGPTGKVILILWSLKFYNSWFCQH